MRKRALARGLSLNEYALTGAEGPDPVQDRGRRSSRRWGWPRSRPSCARTAGEIEAAEAGKLPDLVELGDLTGTFHCHTDWSDGAATLAEMAEAARARGMQYLGIADHSRSAALCRRAVASSGSATQWAEIDALNKTFGGKFHLFKGTECDILADGSLDYPDELLDGFRLRGGERPFAVSACRATR